MITHGSIFLKCLLEKVNYLKWENFLSVKNSLDLDFFFFSISQHRDFNKVGSRKWFGYFDY